ncbi:MAG: hypothetical protein PHO59_03820 [Candidatus Omnitrophica bacterium]|nr:hypothetical protein [Candidatus Omnitrophota bacterium]MDD5137426.1 hypothetical protein [Candidatus Omnitrophota bacterium]MDD5538995.1 hypothetical protein [Candidatus Omnitrophota bacterium]
MKIQILNATGKVFEGAISEAILPGVDGELSIMDNHEPIFVALKRGLIRLTPFARKFGFRVTTGAGPQAQIQDLRPIKIQRGVAHMKGNNELVILVE